MRIIAYYGYLGTLPAGLCVVAASAAAIVSGPSGVQAAILVASGIEFGLTGLLLATNWRGASRRLRARARLDRRRWPWLAGRLCSDSLGWWRGVGLFLVLGGSVLAAAGAVLARV